MGGAWLQLDLNWARGNWVLGQAALTSEGFESYGAWEEIFLFLFQLIHSIPRSRARPGGGAQRPLPPPLPVKRWGHFALL